MIRVERFAGSSSEWNSFARAQKGCTHCHLYEWRSVIENVFGHECVYLAAREGSRLEAVLPLVRVKSLVFGHFLVSMPFLNYGGPIGTDMGIAALTDEATALAKFDGATLVELRSRIPLPLHLPVSHRKITVVLDLASSTEATFSRFDSKLRSQVRRPQKEGVTVKFGVDQLDPFFDVFSRHMRDLGTPTQTKRLFEAIASKFPGDVAFACAYLRGKPVAAGCGFTFGDEFELTWASSLRAYSREAPNMLLYWSFMERAIGEELKAFNFGRCSPGKGTHRFKLQWGGREEPLWWYGYSPMERATTPSPDDGAYSWGPRVWRHLPNSLARLIGPRIVRYIP